MNILDENIIASQCQLFRSWRIRFRQIGYELGHSGMKDQEIIKFLHEMTQPTFFTRDDDFYDRQLCHSKYCLVYLTTTKDEVASFVRRFLRHKAFKSKTKRMGSVVRVSHGGISLWRTHADGQKIIDW